MVAMMNGDRKAIEDRVVKDVIMSGFQADNSTCCEAKLRFMLQQKTQLNDQWRYSRHELLRFLSQSLDKMSRSDMGGCEICIELSSFGFTAKRRFRCTCAM